MNILDEIVDVIVKTAGRDIKREALTRDFKLVGNILDSMAVTNLILGLEDRFGFMFDDDELSSEAFESVGTLAALVGGKLGRSHEQRL